jgi:hypothetical protein
MVNPLAEHRASIVELRRTIAETKTNLAQHKTALLGMTKALEQDGELVSYDHRKVERDTLQNKMQRDFRSYKLLEGSLASNRKLLAAKERTYNAAREQLNKLIAKKAEFELQVAQLEAEQQVLDAAGTGTDVRVNDSRASEIQTALKEIRHRQEVLRAKMALLNGDVVTERLPGHDQPGATPDEVRRYLQGGTPAAPTRTARSQ